MPVDFAVSWQDIHVAAKKLSATLRPVGSWEKMVAVTRGGLVPACLVARDLDIRTIETISIKSYDHQAQTEVSVLKAAADCGDGTGILVIDDLADTGNTFRALRQILPPQFAGGVDRFSSGLAPLLRDNANSAASDHDPHTMLLTLKQRFGKN